MKKMFLTMVSVIMMALMVGCAVSSAPIVEAVPTVEPTATPFVFDLDEYTAKVADCYTKMEEMIPYITRMISYQYNYLNVWKNLSSTTGSSSTADQADLIAGALMNLQENEGVDEATLVKMHDEIRSLYKDIIATEIEGKLASEIETECKTLFAAYKNLYDMALNPSTSIDSVLVNYDTYSKEYEASESILETLLID